MRDMMFPNGAKRKQGRIHTATLVAYRLAVVWQVGGGEILKDLGRGTDVKTACHR